MRFPKAANKQKNGASLTFPDVCKVPAPPAPFVPIPYPNIVAASAKLNATTKKVKVFEKQLTNVKSSSGDEAGTLKGIVSSTKAMSKLFTAHSAKVKAEGKKLSMLTEPKRALKAYPQAVKLQKNFEKKLEAECKKLTEACKADPEQKKIAQKVVLLVTRAARGLNV